MKYKVNNEKDFSDLIDRVDAYYKNKKEDTEYDKDKVEFNKLKNSLDVANVDDQWILCKHLYNHFKIKNIKDFSKMALVFKKNYGVEDPLLYYTMFKCKTQPDIYSTDSEIEKYYRNRGNTQLKVNIANEREQEAAQMAKREAARMERTEAERKARNESYMKKDKAAKVIAKLFKKKRKKKATQKKRSRSNSVSSKSSEKPQQARTKKRRRSISDERSPPKSASPPKTPSPPNAAASPPNTMFNTIFSFFSKKKDENQLVVRKEKKKNKKEEDAKEDEELRKYYENKWKLDEEKFKAKEQERLKAKQAEQDRINRMPVSGKTWQRREFEDRMEKDISDEKEEKRLKELAQRGNEIKRSKYYYSPDKPIKPPTNWR